MGVLISSDWRKNQNLTRLGVLFAGE